MSNLSDGRRRAKHENFSCVYPDLDHRPGDSHHRDRFLFCDGGSLLPGFVYASATVMKVCVVLAVLSGIIGIVWRLLVAPRDAAARSVWPVPRWGILSIALIPSTPLLGTLVVLGTQHLGAGPVGLSAGHFSQLARTAVFVMLAILIAGLLASLTSLIRRERPTCFPLLGLAANIVLVGLFWYLRFYAAGFDQDLWAPPR